MTLIQNSNAAATSPKNPLNQSLNDTVETLDESSTNRVITSQIEGKNSI
jgi:hypothetical protein